MAFQNKPLNVKLSEYKKDAFSKSAPIMIEENYWVIATPNIGTKFPFDGDKFTIEGKTFYAMKNDNDYWLLFNTSITANNNLFEIASKIKKDKYEIVKEETDKYVADWESTNCLVALFCNGVKQLEIIAEIMNGYLFEFSGGLDVYPKIEYGDKEKELLSRILGEQNEIKGIPDSDPNHWIDAKAIGLLPWVFYDIETLPKKQRKTTPDTLPFEGELPNNITVKFTPPKMEKKQQYAPKEPSYLKPDERLSWCKNNVQSIQELYDLYGGLPNGKELLSLALAITGISWNSNQNISDNTETKSKPTTEINIHNSALQNWLNSNPQYVNNSSIDEIDTDILSALELLVQKTWGDSKTLNDRETKILLKKAGIVEPNPLKWSITEINQALELSNPF